MTLFKGLFFTLFLGYGALNACTAFQLKAADGANIYCRSMEYGVSLDSALLVVPRNHTYHGTAPDEKEGLEWTTLYAFVGMNQVMDRRVVSDGMNEKGLVAGSLYLRHFAEYETPDPARLKETIGSWELVSYLLGTCATLEEVKAALPKILVAVEPVPHTNGYVIPLHFYVGDRQGRAIVIEYIAGKRCIFDNPLGVLTNAPTFDWQLTNLSNYVNLSPLNVLPLEMKNLQVSAYGQGTGLLGLPGDFTPTSRFVRASFFSQFATTQKTALGAVRLGFHILNTFDLFEGIVRARPNPGKHAGLVGVTKVETDITQWTIVHDRQNLKTYFRSYDSLRIQMVDLKKLDLGSPGLKEIPLFSDFTVEDVTSMAEPLPTKVS